MMYDYASIKSRQENSIFDHFPELFVDETKNINPHCSNHAMHEFKMILFTLEVKFFW